MSLLFILLIQLVNWAQFLNVTPLSLSSTFLPANNCAAVLGASEFGSRPAFPVTAIFPFTTIYAPA